MRSLVLLLCALLSMGLHAQTEAAPINVGPGNIGDGALTVTGNNWVQVSQWVTPGGSPVDLTTYNGGAPVAFRAFVDLQDCAQVAPADWFKFLGELRMVDDSGRMVYCGAVDTQLGMWHGIAPQVWQRLSIETRNVPGWPSSTPHGQEFYCREGGCTDYGTGACSNGRHTVYPTDQVYYVQLVADPVARTFTLYAFGNGDAGGAAPPTSNNSTPGNKWWQVGSITVAPDAFNFNNVRLQTVLWHSSQALPADTSTLRWYAAHLGPMVSLADQPKPTHVWVDDDYAGGEPPVTPGWGVTRFATIFDGLAAVGGSTVHLGPGIYEEQVEVASDVTIEGSGPSSVIKSPVTLTNGFATSKPVVYVHDTATMALKNLTVDGAGRGNTNYKFIGVAFRNAGGTVENCTVTGIRDTPFSGAQHGVGIYAYNDDGIARAVTVQGCTVVDFQKNAMALNASDTTPMTVTVSDNDITGAGPTTVTAQNGIQTWGDLITGTIDYNDVSGIAYSGTGWVATSILVFYADVLVDNNTVTGGHTCIYNIDGDCDITNNDLAVIKTGGYGYGIIATDPPAAKPSPFGEESVEASRTGVLGMAGTASLLVIDISGNTVVFGGPDNVNTVGIEADAGYGPDDLAVTANNNTVTGFDYGMGFWQCTSSCDTGVFTSIAAHQNNLAGNTSYAFSTNASVIPDATCNWWGSANGPNAPPAYSNPAGGAIEGTTVFSPWLVSPGGACVGINEVVANTSGLGCIHTTDPCVTVPVMFNRVDTTPLRAVSVTFQLSPELVLCGLGIQPGALLTNPPWGSFGPVFQVLDNGSGSYTVDYSILGASCGPTTGGELFTIDVTASGTALPEDVGTITIVSVDARDCGNPFASIPAMPGAPASITIDNSAPDAIAALTAAQLKSGNDVDGTTVITLTWPDVEAGATVELFRKGFGFYPEYDDLGGAAPAAPVDPAAALLAGWTSVGTQVSPYADEINTERDFYYYVAFVTDACGNVSAVSNRTSGTLNYHLGDVKPSATPPPFGDNDVEFLDVSFLGTHYGVSDGNSLYENILDIGPTTDNSTNGRPTTDNRIQFEDLIILAINYGGVSKPMPASEGADRNAVALDVAPGADGIEAVMTLSSTGAVQGVSLPLLWNAEAVEPIAYRSGEMANRQSGRALVLSPEPGTVDAAVFGSTFAGSGELAVVTFRVIGSGDPGIRFGEVIARNVENRPVALETTVENRDLPVTPTVTRLMPSAPNPFLGSTQIRFALAEPGEAAVRVYGMDGRLVRTLLDAALPAGEKSVTWDGRDEAGRTVAAGTYVVRFQAPGATESQRLMRLR